MKNTQVLGIVYMEIQIVLQKNQNVTKNFNCTKWFKNHSIKLIWKLRLGKLFKYYGFKVNFTIFVIYIFPYLA